MHTSTLVQRILATRMRCVLYFASLYLFMSCGCINYVIPVNRHANQMSPLVWHESVRQAGGSASTGEVWAPGKFSATPPYLLPLDVNLRQVRGLRTAGRSPLSAQCGGMIASRGGSLSPFPPSSNLRSKEAWKICMLRIKAFFFWSGQIMPD